MKKKDRYNGVMEPEGKLVMGIYAVRSYSLNEFGLQVKT